MSCTLQHLLWDSAAAWERSHSKSPGRSLARRSWSEEERLDFLLKELTGKRPLLPPKLETTAEVADVLGTFKVIAQLPPDSLGAYVISMAHTASDVLAVVLLQVRHIVHMLAPISPCSHSAGKQGLSSQY